ncbi:uncharacterized protein LOC9640772 [Selaginella moellendorffii]|uniref:uncharacterized protein LOC9640772 n=1 Tax=Selaginella moellendorffii TaxID=88036 RepID=UPI000D1C3EF6|nr:uncharacterized protein LOC9640772 [Selaginella moellendorffii]|eukprot:XP_024515614.1 uncharacterized protein LOC9640772 [Selaginella moellendorffii]
MGNPVGLPLLLAITSVIATAFKWHSAPHKVPFWWNLQGHPVAWAPRWIGLFALPVLQFLIPYVIYQFAARDRDLERQGGESKHAAAHVISVPALFLFFVHIFVILDAATSPSHDFHPRLFVASIALWLLFWFGYNIQYVEFNSTIGILTPWTVSNSTVWKQTQNHASVILMLFGIILLIVSLVCPLGTGFLVTTLVLMFAPFFYFLIYSYCILSNSGEPLLP